MSDAVRGNVDEVYDAAGRFEHNMFWEDPDGTHHLVPAGRYEGLLQTEELALYMLDGEPIEEALAEMEERDE